MPLFAIPVIGLVALWRLLVYLTGFRPKIWVYISAVCGVIMITLIIELIAYGLIRSWKLNDTKTEEQKAFIKWARTELEMIESRMDAGKEKDTVHQLWEAVRYSDPMSNEASADAEIRIGECVRSLAEAVSKKENENILKLTEEAKLLLQDRNRLNKANS